MAIQLTDDERKDALNSLRRFCADELDLDLPVGDLQTVALLDFFLKEVGPSVYNRGVADAQVYLRDRVADLEGVCYEPEFTFWPKGTTGRPRPPQRS